MSRGARSVLAAILVLPALAGVPEPARAAEPSVRIEPESGLVGGAVRVVADGAASAGAVVEFTGPAAGPPSSGIRVAGHRLLRDGAPFVPLGFTMIGALSPTNTGQAGTAWQHLDDTAMNHAAAWGANTIRFQVSQPGLDPQNSLYSLAYVQRVEQAVALARSHGFAVVLSIQDQGLGGGTRHPQPSPATIRDWATLTPRFNNDPHVMYELFNEPQNQDTADGWNVWRNGGPAVDNQGDPAVGHQAVLDAIRASGARNVVLAEGARYAQTLKGMPLLHDPLGQLAYAIHPYQSGVSRFPSSWEGNFGYLTDEFPVVSTEWNIHSWSSFCQPEWPTTGPQLLDYLQAHNIGMQGWAFDYLPSLVLDWNHTPTTLDGFECGAPDKGAGQLLQSRFPTWNPLPLPCVPLTAGEHSVAAPVDVPAAGAYRVWSRLLPADPTRDSYLMQIDDGCPVAVGDGLGVAGTWGWAAAPGAAVNLAAGGHTIRLWGREAGVRVDRLVLTTDPGCVPAGLGDQCATAPPPPTTRSFPASADARVERAHSSTNYGTSTTLRVDCCSSSSTVESYLSFPVSGLSGPVKSARLRVFLSSGSKDGPAVYGTGSGWKESGSGGITWTNRPLRITGVLADRGTVADNAWVEWDVTPFVTGDGTWSFVLATGSKDGVTGYAREKGTNPPALVITTG
jgi:hypothetical protein